MVEKGPIFLVFVLQANALYCNSTFSERKEPSSWVQLQH